MHSNFELCQKTGLFNSFKYTLVGNKEIEFSTKGFFSSRKNSIPFSALNPTPIEYQQLNIKALIYSTFFFIAFLLCVSSYFMLSDTDKNVWVIIIFSTIFAILFINCVHTCVKSSAKVLIFTSADDGSNIFYILPSISKPEEVSEFTSLIKKRCESIKLVDNLSEDHKKEIYARHLEFLSEQGVLTEVEFNTIISRLHESVEKADVIRLL